MTEQKSNLSVAPAHVSRQVHPLHVTDLANAEVSWSRWWLGLHSGLSWHVTLQQPYHHCCCGERSVTSYGFQAANSGSEKWRQCEKAWKVHSLSWPAGASPLVAKRNLIVSKSMRKGPSFTLDLLPQYCKHAFMVSIDSFKSSSIQPDIYSVKYVPFWEGNKQGMLQGVATLWLTDCYYGVVGSGCCPCLNLPHVTLSQWGLGFHSFGCLYLYSVFSRT